MSSGSEARSGGWSRAHVRGQGRAAGSGCAPTGAAVSKSGGDHFRTAAPYRILENLVCHSFVEGKLITLDLFWKPGCLVALGVFQHVDSVRVRSAQLPECGRSVVRCQTWGSQVDVNRWREADTSLPGVKGCTLCFFL